jgi:hypothetical protein
MKRLVLLAGLFLLTFSKGHAQFETVRDSVVQLYGIVMTADSLVGIPAVNVMVQGQNRGTMTNNQGVFSIVVLKGDVVEFSHVSYKAKQVSIPLDLKGNQQSIVQLMVEDTVYLPATIIRPRPTPQQFARDFVNTKVPDDDIEIARQNNSVAKRRALMQSTPSDGGGAAYEHLQSRCLVGIYPVVETGRFQAEAVGCIVLHCTLPSIYRSKPFSVGRSCPTFSITNQYRSKFV